MNKKDEALNELAISLCETMEQLDPSGVWDFSKTAKSNWDTVPDKGYFIRCVQSMLAKKEAIKIVLDCDGL